MMTYIVTICGLVIIFGFEMRHRLITEQLACLDNETHALKDEIKKIKEDLKKERDAELKKSLKSPFSP